MRGKMQLKLNIRSSLLLSVLALAIMAPDTATAGVILPAKSLVVAPGVSPNVELVASKRSKRLKPGCRAAYCKPGYKWAKYRKWKRKKHFGRIVAGVALGTIVVTAANAAPRRPTDDLCWYWANNSRTRGYWDYCY